MKKVNAILLTSLILSDLVYLFWDIIKTKTGVSIFYVGDAFVHLLDKSALFLIALSTNSKWFKLITFTLLCYALNNVADELFFDPTRLQANEILFAISTIIVAFFIFKFKKL